MARRAVASVVSSGICSFCESEVDKRKMTQHLKYCKQRASTIAQENASSATKTSIFHLLVEGQYNPQYWMHLEIPASEELATLDDFLRAIWLECCGHLSAFRINGTSYDSEQEEFIFAEEEEVVDEKVAEEEDEEEKGDGAAAGDDVIGFEELLDDPLFERIEQELPPDWFAEVKKPRSVDDFVVFAKEALKAIPKDLFTGRPTQEEIESYRLHELQRWLLNLLLAMFEDRSLYLPLEKVLKVGQKFSHQYDFGSTTSLSLKVMAEREGIIQDEDDPVKILARNVPPAILCQVCGQPATKVASGYFDVEANAYCDKCADNDEDLLPVVNSPRVGVCGYTGGESWEVGEEEEWEEEDDEEWDDEDEEE